MIVRTGYSSSGCNEVFEIRTGSCLGHPDHSGRHAQDTYNDAEYSNHVEELLASPVGRHRQSAKSIPRKVHAARNEHDHPKAGPSMLLMPGRSRAQASVIEPGPTPAHEH